MSAKIPTDPAVEPHDEPRRGGWLSWLAWVALSVGTGFLSAFAGMPGAWYTRLDKPPWTPPSWLFGPAWTTLYILMGTAAWLVWKDRANQPARAGAAIRLFLIQLVLNGLWTPLFFGLRRPDVAFAEIVVLWVLILVMLFAFARVRFVAGLLIVPYLAWVSFASALNGSIWLRNLG